MAMLDGKVVIVTGGAGGIGSGTSRLLAGEGASVVIADLPAMKPSALAEELVQSGHRAMGVEVDISDEDQVADLIRATVTRFGQLNGLHANAAATHLVLNDGLLTELSRSVFEEAFQVNVLGTWSCCKHAIPVMIEGGGGSIVATSSIAATHAGPQRSSYGITKAAISQLMRTVAAQYGKKGIRANTILPGLIMHPGTALLPKEYTQSVLDNVLTPGLGEPESIGSLVAYLMSDAAHFLQGQEIRVDGGQYVQTTPPGS